MDCIVFPDVRPGGSTTLPSFSANLKISERYLGLMTRNLQSCLVQQEDYHHTGTNLAPTEDSEEHTQCVGPVLLAFSVRPSQKEQALSALLYNVTTAGRPHEWHPPFLVILAHIACFGPISALLAPFRDLSSVLGGYFFALSGNVSGKLGVQCVAWNPKFHSFTVARTGAIHHTVYQYAPCKTHKSLYWP